MIHCKVYRQGREVLVAACDKELVGRELREGKLRLLVSQGFYGGEEVAAGELVRHLRLCTIANLVGERTVSLAIDHGFVARERVLWIGGVPHAQMATL